MTTEEALHRLRVIVDGIDRDELDHPPGGWWETPKGKEFGAGVLEMLEDLVRDLTKD